MKGIEVDTQYLVFDNTRLDADVQFLDAVYDKFVYTVPNFGGPPTANCPAVPAGPVFVLDCSGKTPPQAPRWTVNLGAQQTAPLGDWGSLIGEIRTHFQTLTLTGLEFLQQELQHGYWTTDVSLGYEAAHDRWRLTAYVNNVSDRDVTDGAFPHPLAGAALIAATLRPPRTYGARFSVRF
jgi:iron complex outermembrane receptor protein